MEYTLDEKGNPVGVVMEASEPQVVVWDDTASVEQERAVGAFDVTPSASGVKAVRAQRTVKVPEIIQRRLRMQRDRGEEAPRVREARTVEHDLDTGDTTASRKRKGAPALSTRPRAPVNAHTKRLAAMLARKQQAEQQAQRKRRSGKRREDPKPDAYIPEIIIKVGDT